MDVTGRSHLHVYIRYVFGASIKEDFLFYLPLRTLTKAADVLKVVYDFFGSNDMSFTNHVAVCIVEAPAKIGSRSGFVAFVKHKDPRIPATHYSLHQQALASKSLPKTLKTKVEVISIVYIMA